MPKTVLVSGASRGIGRATAVLAGGRGWNVGVNFLSNKNAAEETADAVQKAGGKAVIIQGDMGQEADAIRVFDATQIRFRYTIDSVVVNAGINAPSMPPAEMSVERMKRVFDTNVLGAYLCAREAARRLPDSAREERDRSIVFVSSAAARLGSPNEFVDYAGSKGAIDTLTIGLSKELGPRGVRVNAVRPGIIDTGINDKGSGDPGRVERLGGQMLLRRAGSAKEVAEAIIWLVESKASYVTGAIIDVAGGR